MRHRRTARMPPASSEGWSSSHVARAAGTILPSLFGGIEEPLRMASDFTAEVFQNQFLPQGAGEVHAIMTVTAGPGSGPAVSAAPSRLIGIVCDTSGSMEGEKIAAAKHAITRLIQVLPPGCSFFVIAGAG